ncbi:MAG: SIR2 family NAD-dependent protein deacylase [Candidatus Promineifilaceae bacterium]
MNIPNIVKESLRDGKVVVLTGAGVSAESGIPTFRDAQTGMWEHYDPQELATPNAFKANPKLVWDWYAWRRQLVNEKRPNAGHHALVAIEQQATDFLLATQNVDGFHRMAGSQNVVELHGNIQRVKCFDRHHIVESWAEQDATPPRCPQCDSFLRPDVVWFGEGLSEDGLGLAMKSAENCDILLSIGTSSMVYPAAYLPELALRGGALFVEINPNNTPLTPYADFVLKGASGTVLPALVEATW